MENKEDKERSTERQTASTCVSVVKNVEEKDAEKNNAE